MISFRVLIATAFVLTASWAAAADGVIAVKSPYDAKETMNRFEGIAKERGLTIFARIDHAAGATKVGKTLRPTRFPDSAAGSRGASLRP